MLHVRAKEVTPNRTSRLLFQSEISWLQKCLLHHKNQLLHIIQPFHQNYSTTKEVSRALWVSLVSCNLQIMVLVHRLDDKETVLSGIQGI